MTKTTATLAGKQSSGMSTDRMIEAAQTLGLSRQDTLSLAQELYSFGFITYFYNAASVVPASEAQLIPGVLAAIAVNAPGIASPADPQANPEFFVNEFPFAHHAVMPSPRNGLQSVALSALGEKAEALYGIIAQAFIDQVRPPAPQVA